MSFLGFPLDPSPTLAHETARTSSVLRLTPRSLATCLAACAALVACQSDRAPASARSAEDGISVVGGVPFRAVFEVVDRIALEEPAGIVNVWPVASIAADEFLIADTREAQVRVYSPTGKLRRAFGPGTGQVESLSYLVRAVRLEDSALLTAGLLGQLTVIPEVAAEAAYTVATPLFLLRDVVVLDEPRILLVGPDSSSAALLHIWDIQRERIVRSFFVPPTRFDRAVITTFPTVAVATRAGTIAAAYTFSDTIVFFDTLGTEQSRLHIPIQPFVVPGRSLPPAGNGAERQALVNRFTPIQDLFWIDDDQLLVQWAKGTAFGQEWGLLLMDTQGKRVWAIAPAPRLVGVRGDDFLFESPRGESPNEWVVARMH